VKESLLRYPVFGPVLRATAAITVTRADPRRDLRDVLEKGVAALNGGSSVMIFPQATRSTVFDPSTFGSLAVKLAGRAGVRVLPVAVKTDFMGVGKRVKEFGPLDRTRTVHFRFGPAIEVEGRKKEAHRDCLRFVSESLQEWGVEAREEE
ncbi:MAG: 1-acyl-sn-glycerol-3-phosphate acyltransferase, partial [Lentisphaerae bacterium]|nr:1-acyl-sn-glycerol-3-phosphate acyltransferase [Lentisphaerota bacterium]